MFTVSTYPERNGNVSGDLRTFDGFNQRNIPPRDGRYPDVGPGRRLATFVASDEDFLHPVMHSLNEDCDYVIQHYCHTWFPSPVTGHGLHSLLLVTRAHDLIRSRNIGSREELGFWLGQRFPEYLRDRALGATAQMLQASGVRYRPRAEEPESDVQFPTRRGADTMEVVLDEVLREDELQFAEIPLPFSGETPPNEPNPLPESVRQSYRVDENGIRFDERFSRFVTPDNCAFVTYRQALDHQRRTEVFDTEAEVPDPPVITPQMRMDDRTARVEENWARQFTTNGTANVTMTWVNSNTNGG